MGQFSWKTHNTNESIWSTEGYQFPVVMIDDKGNTWEESKYEGYGVFGGKDYFQLVAEMNNAEGLTGNVDTDRDKGINIAFNDNQERIIYPVLIDMRELHTGLSSKDIYILYSHFGEAEDCENQGWYNEDDDDYECCCHCGRCH